MTPRTDLLPHLTLTGADGAEVRDDTLLSPGLTVLYFLRSPSCPVCRGHARRLVAARTAGRLAAGVVLVSPGGSSDAASVRAAITRGAASEGLPEGVHVVASGDAHALVGLDKTLMLQHSGTLLVDDQRRIRYARTAAMPPASFHEGELLEAMKNLRATA